MRSTHSLFFVGLSIALFAMVTGGLILSTMFAAENAAQQQALRTSGAIEAIYRVRSALLEAESGQRGFLLTGDQNYLEAYYSGRRNFPTALDELGASLVELENAEREIQVLAKLSEEKFAELDSTIADYSSGNGEAALAVTNTDEGRMLTDMIDKRLQNLLSIKRQRLKDAVDRAHMESNRTFWLLIALSALTLTGFGAAFYNVRKVARLNAVEEYTQALEESYERNTLLTRELDHRVKNLFAVIMSIVTASARHETDVAAMAKKTRERIQAFSNAHSLTSSLDVDASTSLADIINVIVAPQKGEDQHLSLVGPDVHINPKAVNTMGMILHEMTTNALKHGAWSQENGTITIAWEIFEEDGDMHRLKVEWQEEGLREVKETESEKSSFGMQMIDLSVRQLKGEYEREMRPVGLRAEFVIPVTVLA